VLAAKELIRKVFKRYARQRLCPHVCSWNRGGVQLDVQKSILNVFLNEANMQSSVLAASMQVYVVCQSVCISHTILDQEVIDVICGLLVTATMVPVTLS